jgi:hypothetical protein
MSPPNQDPDRWAKWELDEGWLPRNIRVAGKRELLDLLGRWVKVSKATTIGDTRGYHGAFWVTAEIDGHKVRLAADTTWGAVNEVVQEAANHPDRPWRVVRNQRGRVTKVQVTARALPGWYAYIHPALASEADL